MKKLILLTSALTFVGGAASAAITVTAEASVTYSNWETRAAAATFSYDASMTFALEETSGDLTYGGEIGVDADAGTISNGVIWFSGGWGKASFGIDEFDEVAAADDATADINGVFGSNDAGDVKYEGTFGAVSVTLVADAGMGNAPSGATWDFSADYAGNGFNVGVWTESTGGVELSADVDVGSYTVGFTVDDASAWDVWASGTFGAINVKVTADSGSVYGVELDGSAGDFGWAVATNTDSETSASVDYTMGDLSVGLAYDNDDAGTAGLADVGDEADFIVTVGYSMDMVSFEILLNDQSEYEISATAGFEF